MRNKQDILTDMLSSMDDLDLACKFCGRVVLAGVCCQAAMTVALGTAYTEGDESQLDVIQGKARCAAWNRCVPSGSPVLLVKDLGETIETRTRSKAWCLGDGMPVVKVDGIPGCYALERVFPLPMSAVRDTDQQDPALPAEVSEEDLAAAIEKWKRDVDGPSE